MKINVWLLVLFALPILSYSQRTIPKARQGEVIYHVSQRSFYDSNGDLQGDLNGLRQKLDYLQDLGITSILLLPLYEADCYHNYFANNFEKIDAEFGTMADYIALVKAVHQRGMKIYLDMETQYVTSKHIWWKDAVGNLKSPYSDYILFDDADHNVPATMVFNLRELRSYDGTVIPITTVNLKSRKVLDYNIGLFSYFLDPNKDGEFDDGADGFRLDHTMDNLDEKPALTNLFEVFWKPLLTRLKQVNPAITIVAEQANWKEYGFDYFEKAGVDRMFGFGLQEAILSFNKQLLINKADTILGMRPPGKDQLIFLENHDLDRFASLEMNPQKQRVAAAIQVLIGGIPSIYYGQELGMKGKIKAFGTTDGNDIPRREAFEWYQSGDGKGMALWYKNTGEWWTQTNIKANDSISLEEQKRDPASLFNYYKKLIAIKHSYPAFANGRYENTPNDNPNVYSFRRISGQETALVMVNLSDQVQKATVSSSVKFSRRLLGDPKQYGQTIELKPYEIGVWLTK
ncbi:alpha-amylase family glycosyl hydrolase [Spirosoma sp.]|uniref:alpha-amylase family glycosyl hydrolase n=1 Tax=Spirosoma sp. TaxID=1899569 RepID=UPI0026177377|nr:alpha-amylase family glycosyl hydrolase [Spirosoma sp.]MCX6215305.1 alpha-amylase family glycosyl hydrolase [Spirosoma sp.]